MSGRVRVGARDCWKLSYFPEKGAPLGISGPYYLWIDCENGSPQRVATEVNWKPVSPEVLGTTVVAQSASPAGIALLYCYDRLKLGYYKQVELASWLEKAGEVVFVNGAPEGMPIGVFCFAEPQEIHRLNGALQIQKGGDVDQGWEKVTLIRGSKEEFAIKLRWRKGEPWWSEFERYVGPIRDVHARRKIADLPMSAEPSPGWEKIIAIRSDPRLQRLITIVTERPEFEDLLLRMETVTGLRFEVDRDLIGHKPEFGSLQLENAKVWSLLELVADTGLVDGRWVKTPEGYRLLGTSTTVLVSTSGRDYRGWFTLFAIMIMASGSILAYRVSKSRKEARSSGPTPRLGDAE